MVPFEELQQLWRSQPAAMAEPELAARVSELTQAFRRYGRRQSFFNVLRLCVVALQVLAWLRVKEPRTLLTICGMAVLLAAELVFLFSDWRNQLGLARLNFAEPSREFVRNTIERLYDQRNPFRKHGWFLGISVAVAFNLLTLAKDYRFTVLERVAYHLTAFAAPGAVFVIGLRIRGRRWRYDCMPLVERLRGIERAMRENEL